MPAWWRLGVARVLVCLIACCLTVALAVNVSLTVLGVDGEVGDPWRSRQGVPRSGLATSGVAHRAVCANTSETRCAPVAGPAKGDVCCCRWGTEQTSGAAGSKNLQIEEVEELWSCWPSLFIAGAQKSGTTALAALLSLHPNVTPPGTKELHFFDTRFNKAGPFEYLDGLRPPLGFEHDAADGRGLFTFDPTPSYMLGHGTVLRMAAAAPAAKVVVLLRDPGAYTVLVVAELQLLACSRSLSLHCA
jgi:hypothetical protein